MKPVTLTAEAAQQIEEALLPASVGCLITLERANQALATIRAARAQDHGWPHEATVKLRWAGYGPYPECIAWAKRGENGELVTAFSLIPLDESKWEVIDERYDSVEFATEEKPCSNHPDAPHGFDRNASHNAGRYVCECEGWTPEATK